jgi:hypothetical protein
MDNIRNQLDQHGHLAVPLPALAGERAGELLAGVSELLRRPAHLSALAELAEAWASSATERAAVTWGRRAPDAPRGESHLQTVASFDRFVDADPRSPALLRAVVGRLTMFGGAADRLVGSLAMPAHCTVRADVYEPDSCVPTHVDDSVVTIVFTDQPGSLLLALGGRGEPLRAVAARGWHAVVLPGARSSRVFPGLAPSPHAAAPSATCRRSISVFVG